jgi:DNA-binding NarL/FixJ family response regulator
VRRRRKRQEETIQEPVAQAPGPALADPEPDPPLRIVLVGQAGATRESLEATVQAQDDMELVGSFDDMDSGTSGIRANTKRSGVVVMVDVATLETGTMTEIRHLRDRFPFCRFLAYGEAFDDDSASALLFFGADGVAGVNDGPAAVAQVIRRSINPDVDGEVEAETTVVETPTQTEPPADPEREPEPEPEPEPLTQTEPPPEPEAEPNAGPSDEADEDGPAGALEDPGPGPGSGEEIWREVAPAHQERQLRRMTPEDIWDGQPSEIHFESPSPAEPANSERGHDSNQAEDTSAGPVDPRAG